MCQPSHAQLRLHGITVPPPTCAILNITGQSQADVEECKTSFLRTDGWRQHRSLERASSSQSRGGLLCLWPPGQQSRVIGFTPAWPQEAQGPPTVKAMATGLGTSDHVYCVCTLGSVQGHRARETCTYTACMHTYTYPRTNTRAHVHTHV